MQAVYMWFTHTTDFLMQAVYMWFTHTTDFVILYHKIKKIGMNLPYIVLGNHLQVPIRISQANWFGQPEELPSKLLYLKI